MKFNDTSFVVEDDNESNSDASENDYVSELGSDEEEHSDPVDTGKNKHLLDNINKLTKFKPKIHKNEVRKLKSKDKKERRQKAKDLGLPKQQPKTIESKREKNEDLVEPEDTEVICDEAVDEMSSYFNKQVEPKILITSSDDPHSKTIKFCRELKHTIPNAEYRLRRKCSIKKMVKVAIERQYTDMIIINEDWRKPSKFMRYKFP